MSAVAGSELASEAGVSPDIDWSVFLRAFAEEIDLQRSAGGDPPGTWLSPVLEGLCEAWTKQPPGSDDHLTVRPVRVTPQSILLRFGRRHV